MPAWLSHGCPLCGVTHAVVLSRLRVEQAHSLPPSDPLLALRVDDCLWESAQTIEAESLRPAEPLEGVDDWRAMVADVVAVDARKSPFVMCPRCGWGFDTSELDRLIGSREMLTEELELVNVVSD